METGLTKNQIISELTRSPHGKLTEYLKVGKEAATTNAEFFAHLIAWNRLKGQIRDSQVALPVIAVGQTNDEELLENALAHLGKLTPREFLRAYRFTLEVKPSGKGRKIRRLAAQYLREREEWKTPKWDRMAIQHRAVLKELYALAHIKPSKRVDDILFKNQYVRGSIFEAVAQLKDMSPAEAAGVMYERGIPSLIALGALGKKAKEKDLVLALINRMSPTELVTNTKMLERLGMKTDPALRGAYQQALEKAATSKKNALKTTAAVEAVEDEDLKDKLRGLQDRQLQNLGVEGNWLVLADKSGSMKTAIEASRHISATLAKMVKGKVWLVFFDEAPMTVDVTGLTLDQIQKATRHIVADGATSIGCGLKRMTEANEEIDGIAIVSDGGENRTPWFVTAYQEYSQKFGKQVPVYFYNLEGERATLIPNTTQYGVDIHTFDLRGSSVDYYSLPNLVQTMRTNRYSLVDEIMAVPLLKFADVFKTTPQEVLV